MNEQAKLLEDTGERMMPASSDVRTFWEHVYRYRFAARLVRGKRILDVACGEGYGSAALLAAGATSVVGVDISRDACDHARRKYDVDAREGDAEALPIAGASLDVVVSFETIEHLRRPEVFLDECGRVLVSSGTLIISTPNRPVFDTHCPHNAYHCSELDEREFLDLLGSRFPRLRLYSQSVKTAPWWSPRSLCALQSPWRDVRGFWRLRTSMGGYPSQSATEIARRRPLDAILADDSWGARVFSPYLPRRSLGQAREQASYFIAVARR